MVCDISENSFTYQRFGIRHSFLSRQWCLSVAVCALLESLLFAINCYSSELTANHCYQSLLMAMNCQSHYRECPEWCQKKAPTGNTKETALFADFQGFACKCLIFPVSRKSAWKQFWFDDLKLEECWQFWAWILGVIFFFGGGGVAEALEKQGPKNRGKDSLEEFAEKCTGDFSKIRHTPKNQPKFTLQHFGMNPISSSEEHLSNSGSRNSRTKKRFCLEGVLEKLCASLGCGSLSATFGESSRGNTIRGNRTESLWEEICLWEGLWEDLWKPLKNLWKPLKNLWKPLKTSENLSKSLKTSQNLSKPLKNLWKPSLSEVLSETLSEADFLSEALSPVAPILLPLNLSPTHVLLGPILWIFFVFLTVTLDSAETPFAKTHFSWFPKKWPFHAAVATWNVEMLPLRSVVSATKIPKRDAKLQQQWSGPKKTMTARDVTGFCAFFSAWKSGNFLHIFGRFPYWVTQ